MSCENNLRRSAVKHPVAMLPHSLQAEGASKGLSRREVIPILKGLHERVDHARIVVLRSAIQLANQELITGFVWVATQVTKVLHQHEHAVVLAAGGSSGCSATSCSTSPGL